MVTHRGQLARLVVVWIAGIVDGFGRPDTDVAVLRRR